MYYNASSGWLLQWNQQTKMYCCSTSPPHQMIHPGSPGCWSLIPAVLGESGFTPTSPRLVEVVSSLQGHKEATDTHIYSQLSKFEWRESRSTPREREAIQTQRKDVQPSRSEVEVLTTTEPPWKDHIEAFKNKTGKMKRIVQDFEQASIYHCTVNGKVLC